jgi:hypothetical protein
MKSRSMILSLWGSPTSHSWAPAGHRPQPVLGTGDGPGEGGRRSGGDNGLEQPQRHHQAEHRGDDPTLCAVMSHFSQNQNLRHTKST